MKTIPLICLLAGGIAAGTCFAAPVPEGLLACERITNIEERAHCYDTQLAAMKAEATASRPSTAAGVSAPSRPAGQTGAPAPAPQAAPSEQAKVTRFGFEQLPAPERPRADPHEGQLVSTITSIQSMDPDIWLITLANGQVWRQHGTQITSFFQVRDSVRLKKGVLGDYHLSSDRIGKKGWVLVTRVH